MSTDNSTCMIMGLVGTLLQNCHLFLCGAMNECLVWGWGGVAWGRHFM